jgi:hypothetical protein
VPSPPLPSQSVAGQQPSAPGTSKAAFSKPDNVPASGELARKGMFYGHTRPGALVEKSIAKRAGDVLALLAFWLLRAGAVAGGLALAYLLFGIFGAHIGQVSTAATRAEAARLAQVTENVRLASTILSWSLVALGISMLILMADDKVVGPATAALGFVMHFGAAPLLSSIGQTQAVFYIIGAARTAGFALTVLGLMKYAFDFTRWLMELPNRMQHGANVGVADRAEVAQQRAAAHATMFSPCWQLPFCREVIRKQCPAYLAKTRCWKFGRGCYCDEEMISRIVRGEAMNTVSAPTRMSRQGKPPCGRCYIFLEHQRLKYNVVSPLAIPATIVAMFVGWPLYTALFSGVADRATFLWDKLAFSATKATTDLATKTDPYQLSRDQVQHVSQTLFGVILGFFVLIYVSKIIEWAIYKAKL